MADAAAAVTEAPKKAFKFAENNLLAFAILAVVVLLAFVAVEKRKPGTISSKLAKIPVLGPWAYQIPKPTNSASA